MELTNIMRPENMTLELKATDREGAIRELIELLYASGAITDKHEIMKAVLQREEEFSTGIGFQVAIPHAKSRFVRKASIAYGASAAGVDWPSEDGVDPRMIFLIAVPDTVCNEHLKLLAQISRKIIHDDVRERILNAEKIEDVIHAFDK